MFSTQPFASSYVFDGPSGVFLGESGNTYVIDAARNYILILDESKQYLRTIEGGNTTGDSFYYATAVADGPNGIYVADVLYSGKGTIVSAERILHFEADGSNGKIIWKMDYPDSQTAPRQYGKIKSLRMIDGQLVFTVADENNAVVYTLDPAGGEPVAASYDFGESYVAFACASPVTHLPVIIAGDTTLQTMDETETAQLLVRTDAFPYQAAVTDDGTIWFSELHSGTLMRVDEKEGMISASDEVYAYYISSCRNTVCISDGTGIAFYQDGQMTYLTEVPLANAGLRNFMWILALLCGLGVLVLLVLCARTIVRSWLAYPFFRKIAVVLIIAVIAASGVSWYLLSKIFQEQDTLIRSQMAAFSEQIVAETDLDLLGQIKSSADYKGDAFNALKAKLDRINNEAYERGEYFYYLIYTTDGEQIYAMMDYEDTARTWMVFNPYGVEGYTDVFETGETLFIEGEVSTWGSWTLQLNPVFDDEGNVAAVQEIGFNFDNQLHSRRQTIIDTILTILFGSIVLVMLIIEGIYFGEHRRKKREALLQPQQNMALSDWVPLRTLIFLAFLVDCMQDAFISILATRLYQPFWGIPQSVGAALPISGQVLMAAIFAVLGGFLSSRIGAKRVICTGFLLQASGFFLCGITLQYFGILIGKLMVGMGVGLISVGVNTTATASGPEKSVAIFSGITAGTLAGVSAGSGLGSTLLSLGGYRAVFFTGTAILLVGLLLAITSHHAVPAKLPSREQPEQSLPAEESSIGLGKFLLGKGGVLPFLLMILMPFMTGIYFREYFFPIFSAENGLTETNIGRIYVLCGLLVIYAGPSLTRYLTERLGSIRTVVLTSALISLASLSYGLLPNMLGAIIGVVLVSLAVSCGYTAQSSYYASLRSVAAFGEGRAMGIYSMFDNGGQTLGPVLYGSAMLLGYQAGMLCVGSVLAVLTILFSVTRRKDFKAKNTQNILQEETTC